MSKLFFNDPILFSIIDKNMDECCFCLKKNHFGPVKNVVKLPSSTLGTIGIS